MSRPTQDEIEDDREGTKAATLEMIAAAVMEDGALVGVLEYLQRINGNLARIANALECER